MRRFDYSQDTQPKKGGQMAQMAIDRLQEKITEYLNRAKNERKILAFTDAYGYVFSFYEGVGELAYCIVKHPVKQEAGEAMIKGDGTLMDYACGGQALLIEIVRAYQSEPKSKEEIASEKLNEIYLLSQTLTGLLRELVELRR